MVSDPPPGTSGDRVPVDYKSAGVDIDAGHEAVRRIRMLARRTFSPSVISDIGSFGGLFRPDLAGVEDPVLVASADGVGTKLKVAFLANRHDTVGIDLVNHCVNDIIVQGARPLFFMDYLATGRLSPGVTEAVVGGMASACSNNKCALLGGETAEMPGFYADGEYDLAGFIVGLVDRARLVDGQRIQAGDVLIGLPSTGLHTNGYSLARHILFDVLKLTVESTPAELDGAVGDVLLRPHRSYLPVVGPVLDDGQIKIKGLAHVTGGGLTDNVPRVFPEGVAAEIDCRSWTPAPIFRFLQEQGHLSVAEAYRTFNMGIGMVVVSAPEDATALISAFEKAGELEAVIIGQTTHGDGTITYI